ncbi:MAG UNVERIFIED_CONTAM: hypothetical protein LVR18_02400 [Planctomycetaceae bacterium]|jgi:hypothetical protein
MFELHGEFRIAGSANVLHGEFSGLFDLGNINSPRLSQLGFQGHLLF